jgi:subfamily B ATP-binding cassette protein MsbA
LVGILDGLGLSMFLPLLEMVSSNTPAANDNAFLNFLYISYGLLNLQMNLQVVLATMIFFFILKGVFTFINAYYNTKLLELFSAKLRVQTVSGLNNINFKAFATSDMGRIQNALTGEVDRLARAFVSYFATMQQLILVIVYAFFAFLNDYRFALLVAIGGFLSNFLFQFLYKYTKKLSRSISYHFDVYEGKIIQHVQNFKYLKATGLLTFFGNRLKQTISEIQQSRTNLGIVNSLVVAAREPILVIVVAGVIHIMTSYMGGQLGLILMSLLFFYRALSALTILQTNWNQYLMVSGSMENMQDFLQELEQTKEPNGTTQFITFKKHIELKNVKFYYGDTLILDDINLIIPKNKSIAFVGESGSGKTTLVNILAGLLPIDRGSLNIDGIPLQDLSKESYQKRIGYITQEPVVFNDTIFNNITLWAENNEINQKRFWNAIKLSSLESFIINLPQKENTPLGHSGISLSGGQRQRLSIARELFKDIDILIMDEATSALDSETEWAIKESIEALHGKYTIISVAHRLSTIKNADEVVFMENGKILGIDTFERLSKQIPRFKRMVEFQEL